MSGASRTVFSVGQNSRRDRMKSPTGLKKGDKVKIRGRMCGPHQGIGVVVMAGCTFVKVNFGKKKEPPFNHKDIEIVLPNWLKIIT